MKTITCDLCGHIQERKEPTRPDGWAHFRVDYRNRGNSGSCVYTLDICRICNGKVKFDTGAKAKAVQMVKASMMDHDPHG